MNRWLRAAAWPAGAVLGMLAIREQERVGRSASILLTELLVGWIILGVGLVGMQRRPNRTWTLLTVAGFLWFVGVFEPARSEDVGLVAFAFGRWYELFLVWAVLAYPTGRLLTRDRFLVVAVGVLIAMRTLSRLFLHVPPDFTGCDCVENRFLPITDDRWWRTVEDVYTAGFAVATFLVLGSVAVRWRAASRPGRRMLTPGLLAATALSVGVTYEWATGWNADLLGTAVQTARFVAWSHAAVAAALALGIARLHQTRSAVVDLVAELGTDLQPDRLEEALRRALGDPTLTLLPWSPEAESASTDDPMRATTRVERHGAPVALLVHDAALLEDPGMVAAVVAAVRLTADNQLLQAEVEAQLAEVAASRQRIVAAGDEVRRRIERDLHDGAQQRLVTIALTLRLAEARLDADADGATRAVLEQAVADLTEAIDELRDLARGIHPSVLTEAGLGAALESLADRSPIPVTLDLRLAGEPEATIAAALYFSAAEALTNAAKHARAGHVTIRAVQEDGRIQLDVVDDGEGGADVAKGTGLRGIADRLATVDGTVSVDSPPAAGTRVMVQVPCASS